MRIWPFGKSKPLPKTKDELIEALANEFPWQVTQSGYAAAKLIDYKDRERLLRLIELDDDNYGLTRFTRSASLGGFVRTAIDPVLEKTINNVKKLSAHAAADEAKKAQTQQNPSEKEQKPSGTDLIDRGNQKNGPAL